MTKEERLLRQEQRERAKAIEAAAREAGRGPLDLPYLLLVLMLVGVGLIMLFSASFPSAYYEKGNPAYYLIRQGLFAVVGIVAMAIIGKTNYERFRGAARIALIGSIILLVIVLIPGVGTGKLTHGAQRWIRMGPLQFQPSELAKVGVILYFADSISKKRDRMATFREGILPYAGILATIAILMGLEPHLSGMVLLLGIGAVMMYVGGIRNYWVFAGFVVVAFVAYAFATGLITYNSSRISIWLDPFNEEWMRDKGYQIRQSLLSIGSGGLFGKGLFQGTQHSLGLLPEAPTDFIFCVLAEELGFLGALVLLGLYIALVLISFRIARSSGDLFGMVIVMCVVGMWLFQILENIGMDCGLMPITGIPLPFMSYGSSFMVVNFVMLGMIGSVWSHNATLKQH